MKDVIKNKNVSFILLIYLHGYFGCLLRVYVTELQKYQDEVQIKFGACVSPPIYILTEKFLSDLGFEPRFSQFFRASVLFTTLVKSSMKTRLTRKKFWSGSRTSDLMNSKLVRKTENLGLRNVFSLKIISENNNLTYFMTVYPLSHMVYSEL